MYVYTEMKCSIMSVHASLNIILMMVVGYWFDVSIPYLCYILEKHTVLLTDRVEQQRRMVKIAWSVDSTNVYMYEIT